MSDKEFSQLRERVDKLEKQLEKSSATEPKKPRKKSDYNIFVQEYIKKQREGGSKLTPMQLISEAAGEWTKKKGK